MCQAIYISSERGLPEINWDKNAPGFYVLRIHHAGTLKMLEPILNAPFIYEALSHMGCSCGLFYDDRFKDNEDENYDKRVKDVHDFVKYLDRHKKENKIQIFSSDWTQFYDHYPQKNFDISQLDKNEFYLEEMTILQVV